MVLQISGEVFVPLFWGDGTLMVMKIYSETFGYVFNDMETLNMMMIFLKKHLIGSVGVLDTLYMMSI